MDTISIKEHSILDFDYSFRPINVLDLGACKGEFSVELKRLSHPDSRFLLIEPNPTNFLEIPDNFEKIQALVDVATHEQRSFVVDDDSPYNGTCLTPWFYSQTAIAVKTIGIQDLVNKFNRIDILKIDIEGLECEILNSLPKKDLDKISQITVEFHDFLFPELRPNVELCVKRLRDNGFHMKNFPINYKYNSQYYDTLFFK